MNTMANYTSANLGLLSPLRPQQPPYFPPMWAENVWFDGSNGDNSVGLTFVDRLLDGVAFTQAGDRNCLTALNRRHWATPLDALNSSLLPLACQGFLGDAESRDRESQSDLEATPRSASNPEREPIQILVIGSSRGIDTIVRTLHQLRFAEVREWSPLLPSPTPGKLMRTLTRYLISNNGN